MARGHEKQAIAGNGNDQALDGDEDQARQQQMMRRAQAKRREGIVTMPTDDEMSVVAVDEQSINEVRYRLSERSEEAIAKGWLAHERFGSILRRREAAPVLEKGFGETATKAITGWFTGKTKALEAVLAEAAEVAEEGTLAPVETVKATIELAKEGFDNHVAAGQMAAKLNTIDQILNTSRQAITRRAAAMRAAIHNGNPQTLFASIRRSIIGRL